MCRPSCDRTPGAQRAHPAQEVYKTAGKTHQAAAPAVGCACGAGVIDWRRIVRRLKAHGFQGVLSVECGNEAEAAQSLAHLTEVCAEECV